MNFPFYLSNACLISAFCFSWIPFIYVYLIYFYSSFYNFFSSFIICLRIKANFSFDPKLWITNVIYSFSNFNRYSYGTAKSRFLRISDIYDFRIFWTLLLTRSSPSLIRAVLYFREVHFLSRIKSSIKVSVLVISF